MKTDWSSEEFQPQSGPLCECHNSRHRWAGGRGDRTCLGPSRGCSTVKTEPGTSSRFATRMQISGLENRSLGGLMVLRSNRLISEDDFSAQGKDRKLGDHSEPWVQ